MALGYDAADDPPGWKPDPRQLAVNSEIAAHLPDYHINVGLVWQLLLAYPEDHPVRQPVVQLSRLTPEKVQHIAQIKTGLELYRLWEHRMQDYYYFQLFGALLLDSPLGERLAELITQETPAAERDQQQTDFYELHRHISRFLLGGLPQMTALLCNIDLGSDGQPEPDADPDGAERYRKATEQRDFFREFFAEHAPSLLKPITFEQLKAVRRARAANLPDYKPRQQGPALTLPFSQPERSTLLVALALPATLAALEEHPFSVALSALSGFKPAGRAETLARRLRETAANRQVRLVLDEVVTLAQAVSGLHALVQRADFPALLDELRDRLNARDDVSADVSGNYRLLADPEWAPVLRKTAAQLAKSLPDNLHKYYRKEKSAQRAHEEIGALAELI